MQNFQTAYARTVPQWDFFGEKRRKNPTDGRWVQEGQMRN